VRGREVREGEVADRWGPRDSESELANGQSVLTGWTHRAARGNRRASEGTSVDKLAPLSSGRERGRERAGAADVVRLLGGAGTRGLAGLDWAECAEFVKGKWI
jgi:hypothetical protein